MENNWNELSDYIKNSKSDKKIRLFLDIETYQYNENEGIEKPTNYKNMTYSVAVSFFKSVNDLKVCVFPNFLEMFEAIFKNIRNKLTYKPRLKPTIQLIIHNGNKYDNHFLLKDIQYFYPNVTRYNMYLKNAVNNTNRTQLKQLTTEQKFIAIFEKRVKSSNNLEMTFFIEGVRFETVDNYVKTSLSIRTLGKKLLAIGAIKEEELKTDFDYEEFNVPFDMSEDEAQNYAKQIFYERLTEKHFIYIRNDVIILAQSVKNYPIIFNGFDYDKMTFTSNILDSYNQTNKTSYQLLKQVKDDNNKVHKIKYTDYQFDEENLYDYIKHFYKGGANFYNPKYLGIMLTNQLIALDINSSYPYVMYAFKIPYRLRDFKAYQKLTQISLDLANKDIFQLFKVEYNQANQILKLLPSHLVKQIIVKYYNIKGEFVYLNSNVLRLIEKLSRKKITELVVKSVLTFDCEYFDARNKIADYYFIKTQGKSTKKLIMHDPMNFEITEEENFDLFTEEEIYNSKVNLNGLYGIPALRAYFNLFEIDPDTHQLINQPNGFKNSERNLIFSVFVTSQAFFNLLSPLAYLPSNKIDEWLVYGDTDSLYLDKQALEYLPNEMFHDMNLGAWGGDSQNITNFYVINHKKYAYFKADKKPGKIVVKCGGIPLDTFDTSSNDFEKFINEQFHVGLDVHNQKSIYNANGTISIYPSTTTIDKGTGYFSTYSPRREKMKQVIFEQIRKEVAFTEGDAIYYDTPIGTFTDLDVFPVVNEWKNKPTCLALIQKEFALERNYIDND